MRTRELTFILCFLTSTAMAQNEFKKGSYGSYGSMVLEDNSIFLEEAFNQSMGSIQYITTSWMRKSGQMDYSFTQEIPITDQKHQFSYTLNYFQRTHENQGSHGFGDIVLGYRYQLMDDQDWMMVIPRLSVILPTGNAAVGFGGGALGLQANIAATKRFSKKVVTHYNVGVTQLIKSDYYNTGVDATILAYEKNLFQKNLGASVVWHPAPYANLLVEYVALFEQELQEDQRVSLASEHIINPAIRFSLLKGNMQIVPGISAPVVFDGGLRSSGILFYLSIETNY